MKEEEINESVKKTIDEINVGFMCVCVCIVATFPDKGKYAGPFFDSYERRVILLFFEKIRGI